MSVSSYFNSCTCKFVDVNVLLPEISADTCIPSTSKQSPKFTSLPSVSLKSQDAGNRSKWILNLILEICYTKVLMVLYQHESYIISDSVSSLVPIYCLYIFLSIYSV